MFREMISIKLIKTECIKIIYFAPSTFVMCQRNVVSFDVSVENSFIIITLIVWMIVTMRWVIVISTVQQKNIIESLFQNIKEEST